MIKATICIPTYNGEEFLEDTLKQIFKQDCDFEFEVLVIDSGSTDNTLAIVKRFPKAQLHQIPNSEFGHGKTRNLAAKLGKGEYMVFLTQDAVPGNKRWLEHMLEPFLLNDKIVCVFGKQVPRPFCVVHIKREVFSVFRELGPDHSIMVHRRFSLSSDRKVKHYLTFFSDVNSAVRRDFLLNTIPFRDINYSEDQALGMDVLDAGYIKAYAPLGSVQHSHDYPLKKFFHRKFDEYCGLAETGQTIYRYGPLTSVKSVVGSTFRDWLFIRKDTSYTWKHKLYNLAVSPLYNIALISAVNIAGTKSLREKYQTRLSLEAKSKKD